MLWCAVGFLATVFDVFRSNQVSVDVVATSEVSISLSLDPKKCWHDGEVSVIKRDGFVMGCAEIVKCVRYPSDQAYLICSMSVLETQHGQLEMFTVTCCCHPLPMLPWTWCCRLVRS